MGDILPITRDKLENMGETRASESESPSIQIQQPSIPPCQPTTDAIQVPDNLESTSETQSLPPASRHRHREMSFVGKPRRLSQDLSVWNGRGRSTEHSGLRSTLKNVDGEDAEHNEHDDHHGDEATEPAETKDNATTTTTHDTHHHPDDPDLEWISLTTTFKRKHSTTFHAKLVDSDDATRHAVDEEKEWDYCTSGSESDDEDEQQLERNPWKAAGWRKSEGRRLAIEAVVKAVEG
ncbi:hypothetical protein BJ508DRAFT_331912, partial [Ascobolus immersus RN42]